MDTSLNEVLHNRIVLVFDGCNESREEDMDILAV